MPDPAVTTTAAAIRPRLAPRRKIGRAGCFVVVAAMLLYVERTELWSAIQTQSGTARIAGVVVDAQSPPQPVHRAIVTLTGAEVPTGRAAVTDDTGRFTFDQLPAGRFTLAATKPAYLKMTYGASRPGGTGTPITLAASQQVSDLRMTLPHGGAIAGVIRDRSGAPGPALQVYVVRTNAPAPSATLRGDAVTTDDRGAYRVFGLLPGTYVVSAMTVSSGGIGEVGVMSSPEVDAAFAALRRRAAGPVRPSPASSSPSSIVRPTQPYSVTPVFYPGVPAPGAANQITLGLGEERADIDFVFQLARSASVSGTVTGIAGGAVSVGMTSDAPFAVPASLFTGPMLQQRSIGSDGVFTFTSVTPGKYTLTARVSPSTGRAAGAQADAPVLFAMTTLEVRGDDISGLSLALQAAPHVTGRIVFEKTSATATPDPTAMSVRLLSPTNLANTSASGAIVSTPSQPLVGGRLRADGTFDINGALPGSFQVSAFPIPAGWRVKSATLGGKELADLWVEVGPNDVTGLTMTLTDSHTQISGRLLQTSGAPVTDYFVVAFPADRALWLPQSRRMKSTRPATDGQFHFDDLPAGDYILAAIGDADQEDWQTPAFLALAASAGVKIAVADGDKKTQDLRIR